MRVWGQASAQCRVLSRLLPLLLGGVLGPSPWAQPSLLCPQGSLANQSNDGWFRLPGNRNGAGLAFLLSGAILLGEDLC